MRPERIVNIARCLVVGSIVFGLSWAPARAEEEPSPSPYLVGVGIADVTGEAAGVGMMGYGSVTQRTTGIHQRLWSRAFVVAEPDGERLVIVVADLGMIFQGVHQEVMQRLAARFGNRYRDDNVILSATHTHSGPGGFSHYKFYNLTTFGFRPKTFEAIVSGIVRSIERADRHLAPGRVKIARGELTDASVNRSPEAYLRNPKEERERYGTDIDPEMVVLRFEQGATPVGALSWFATHAVSVTNRNTLISGDNKGFAAYHWEHDILGVRGSDRGRFVAAFAQSNPGDMSPNIRDGKAVSPGPTNDGLENARIIGTRQYEKARALFDGATEELSGPVETRFRYVNFSEVVIAPRFTDGKPRRTCPAAFGQSFTAGTEDGRGLEFIREGQTKTNPILATVGWLIAPVSEDLQACHGSRVLVLASGTKSPPWSPEVLPVQVARIGQLAIASAPGEFTIMSGRRVKRDVAGALGDLAEHVVFAGYANAYAGYVTTPEEYEAQHYEAGFVHFGKWTLSAWQQELTLLAEALRDGTAASSDLRPRDLSGDVSQWGWGPFLDAAPPGSELGELSVAPDSEYRRGDEVRATFYTGHPSNDTRNEKTFLQVEREEGNSWKTVATDDDWSTSFHWSRSLFSFSSVRVAWKIPEAAEPGRYRIRWFGDAQDLSGRLTPVSGQTEPFVVR